ncbi:MAG: DUF1559 domain-containing protein, partial [Pirellulales bacterium]|nr:DUF1559 domain-containing protein [Pirellulales bacterium]
VSWVVSLLSNLDRADLTEKWEDSAIAWANKPRVTLKELVCPSDPSDQSVVAPLAYAVNCGLRDANDPANPSGADLSTALPEKQSAGVFFNHGSYLPPTSSGSPAANPATKQQFMSIAQMTGRDGPANTVLLTENLQTTSWVPPNGTDKIPAWRFEWHVGINWQPYDMGANPSIPPAVKINGALDAKEGELQRPSSRHPGGVVMSFCDGRQQFVSDSLDYLVYQHIMTPHGAAVAKDLAMPDTGAPNLRNSSYDPASLQ